mgnify:CR=1 FL=1
MILEMKVPSPGESITEVEIAEWLVQEGDYVEKDQAIASEVDEDGALFGRIDSGIINYVLKNTIAVQDAHKFYLCGPEGMINTVNGILIENGVEASQVLFELFTTSTIESTSNTSTKKGESKITILVDEEETTLSMLQKQTILEAALSNDIDVPYSCQGGVCSSCICRVTEGSASMRQNNVLTDNEVAEGLVLSCQAKPTSTTIKVDFDDI